MSVRNLDRMFRPRSVALIGASGRERSIGGLVAQNLIGGGFSGPLHLVNPKHRALYGRPVFPSVEALPEAPDLAVITTPPATVPGIVDALARRGTGAAVVITAFPSHGTAEGGDLKRAMLQAARPALLRVLGPNGIGLLVPGIGLNASFSHLPARPGPLAFLAQSGALVTAMLDWAEPRGIGFSHVVSMGDMADVDFGDMLDFLAADMQTRAILLYVEAITHARKFLSAARIAARTKPVIAIKAGRFAEGARAAASHTGALAGADEVYDAAFRRAGMLRVTSIEELFDAAQTLSTGVKPKGDRLAILTNGGGIGVLATDALMEQGGHLAALAPETIAALDKVLPPTWSRSNPVDIIGDADGARYAAALDRLLEDPNAAAILVLNGPTAVADSSEVAQAVLARLAGKREAVFTSWVGGAGAEAARRRIAAQGVPTYDTPESAVRGFLHLVRHAQAQAQLLETPPSLPDAFSPDPAAAMRVIAAARAEGRALLSEPEAKEVLAAYDIPTVPTRIVTSPEEARSAAQALGSGPYVVKILSRDISHKSDLGGVMLDLPDAAAVEASARRMQARIAERAPSARLDGFTVQPMLRRPGGIELILGMSEDRQFGPVILFGQGGVAVEVVKDKAVALPPLNLALARALIERTRVFRLLQGYRDRKPADLDAVALTLVKLSQLVADLPDIAELDINPLIADPSGVVALDARIGLRSAPGPQPRFAIRPYPKELERHLLMPEGGSVFVRPVRPEDEPALLEAFRKLDPADVRLRFFAPLKEMPHELAARLTQIDYEREMALIGWGEGGGLAGPLGIARLAADPDNLKAEFAVIVRSDLKGRGIGSTLMRLLIDYARARGIGALFGEVLAENRAMLALARDLGFTAAPDEAGIVRVTLPLDRPPADRP
jgi:acetyltransferase